VRTAGQLDLHEITRRCAGHEHRAALDPAHTCAACGERLDPELREAAAALAPRGPAGVVGLRGSGAASRSRRGLHFMVTRCAVTWPDTTMTEITLGLSDPLQRDAVLACSRRADRRDPGTGRCR
jgi:hypothetical protein